MSSLSTPWPSKNPRAATPPRALSRLCSQRCTLCGTGTWRTSRCASISHARPDVFARWHRATGELTPTATGVDGRARHGFPICIHDPSQERRRPLLFPACGLTHARTMYRIRNSRTHTLSPVSKQALQPLPPPDRDPTRTTALVGTSTRRCTALALVIAQPAQPDRKPRASSPVRAVAQEMHLSVLTLPNERRSMLGPTQQPRPQKARATSIFLAIRVPFLRVPTAESPHLRLPTGRRAGS
ncbi:hypothetical protein L226DRAFT_310775 [Lentinus tigrinus ALCF2SS1-7]|uniref:Uncharacterized protein n=1 Tax=Lentinus tigrinus ALCF2SS1-6 TaxID=1328759 RepID=A0A5C2S6L7_9APHY|nr:hypothetical protein L227DRAFT_175493 [Lentinus tigrinus ALCF2SS1-6]RPD68937.1 hypothetical protein L226DRAFT_310775 [Lentinus tigrinus ALCF2SS1-7]